MEGGVDGGRGRSLFRGGAFNHLLLAVSCESATRADGNGSVTGRR